eukprot:m.160374 g.160374  ORF g.160374 m.160374 type:complete len:481 (+) comp9849_c1_seq3:242-1684(+)
MAGDVWTRRHLAYGGAAMCKSLLHNIFLLYHVEVFLQVWRIDGPSFWLCEAMFLVYNCLNDFVAGALSDSAQLEGIAASIPTSTHTDQRVSFQTIQKRLRAVSHGGPLFCGAFLLFWFPWTEHVALQFAVALIAYDGLLSYMDVNHSALLVDLAPTEAERARYVQANAIFSAIGSASVFVSFVLWDPEAIGQFQLMCVVMAALCAVGFVLCGRELREQCMHIKKMDAGEDVNERPSKAMSPLRMVRIWGIFLGQMLANRNFMLFSGLHLVQVFHCHFNSNFFPLMLSRLLGGHISRSLQSLLLGISFTLPHINNYYFSKAVATRGAYDVIRALLWVKTAMAAVMFWTGPDSVLLLCIFIASNRIFTEGTCKLLGLVISDLVDEDYILRRRAHPLSALIFGAAALFAKPGQTIAPLLGTTALDRIGAAGIQQGVFYLLVLVPLCCGAVQLLCWAAFSLRGDALHAVQHKVLSRSRPKSMDM